MDLPLWWILTQSFLIPLTHFRKGVCFSSLPSTAIPRYKGLLGSYMRLFFTYELSYYRRLLLFQLFFLLLLPGNTPFWTGVQYIDVHASLNLELGYGCSVLLPRKESHALPLQVFALVALCTVGFSLWWPYLKRQNWSLSAVEQCCRTARKWGTDDVQKLGMLRNAVRAVVAIGAYWHSLPCVPSDQSALCIITGSIFISQVGVSAPQCHLHAHTLVCVHICIHMFSLPISANFLSTDLV